MRKIELLAPAGSEESLKAAVSAGADAVYLGGTKFGARAYANNLSTDDMKWAIDYAHLHDTAIYITINTLLKEQELEQELYDYVKPVYEQGADAVIVQDIGVVRALGEWFPDLPVHISTQMTVTGTGGFDFLKQFPNVTRVVTARELSFNELQKIREHTDLEIESFVHGALCYCYSGQCLFSSMIGGRSGNRGRCAQPCRLPYEVICRGKRISDPNENYLLSPKDMNALELLPQILDMGIDSLKIEGRMKRPEYTAGVVRIYRKYIDRYLEKGSAGMKILKEDIRELEDLYRKRGYSKGYYVQHNGRNMMALSEPVPVKEEAVRNALMEKIRAQYVEKEKKEKIKGILEVSTENPMKLMLEWGEIRVEAEGSKAMIPKNRAMAEADFVKQLSKTGNTPFEFEKLDVFPNGEVFVPNGAINELRRTALELLEKKKTEAFRRVSKRKPLNRQIQKNTESEKWEPVFHALVETMEQLKAVLENDSIMIVSIDSSLMDMEALTKLYSDKRFANSLKKRRVYYRLPAVFREKTRERYDAEVSKIHSICWDGFLIRNLESFEWLKQQKFSKEIIVDAGLYTFNRRACEFWKAAGIVRHTVPVELNSREIIERGAGESEMIIYGHLPMMISAGCVYRTMKRCLQGSKESLQPADYLSLKDRRNKQFPVKPVCRDCYNVIYNAQPLSLLNHEKQAAALKPEILRLDFTLESYEQTKNIIDRFIQNYIYGEAVEELSDFTRGHFKRGVE
ncbi:MAG: DUF3656 domain-containing protein [Lachnospiraceae bacterium]